MRPTASSLCAWLASVSACGGGVAALAVTACADSKAPAQAEPVKAEPAKAEPASAPASAPAPGPAPASACDPSGTWEIESTVQDEDDGCGSLNDEKFSLALGFTGEGADLTLASAAMATGEGSLGHLLSVVHAARVAGPRLDCGLRVTLGPTAGGAPTHAELLFSLERGELAGVGTWWGEAGGKRCVHSLSLFGKRSAATPAAWAQLGPSAAAPELAAIAPASAELAASVAKLGARALLGGVTAKRAQVKLRGPLSAYVAAVVAGPSSVRLLDVPCSGRSGGRCVAVDGDPCLAGLPDAGEGCEGMFLTVVVDPRTGALDRADAGGYPVESQADVEARLDMAP